jgi:zinc D-Ala-D-Ala carboxypeptidase
MTEFVYFTRSEFDCSETGENEIPDAFVHRLDELRERCGFPFNINSGYRSPNHSIEAAKDAPGEHTRAAADIGISGGTQRYILQREAYAMGFTGIGVHKQFIHVDDRASFPSSWPY